MLSDTITLAVDEANNSTPVNHVMGRSEEGPTKTVYYDAAHTVAARDTMAILRQFAKQSGNFYGTTKVAIKFTKDITVTGVNGENIKVPIIGEASFSLPVGCTNAQNTLLRQKLIAILDDDSEMDPLFDQGVI